MTISRHTGGNWISLGGNLGGGAWNLETIVTLDVRDDINRPNSSPVSLSKPIY